MMRRYFLLGVLIVCVSSINAVRFEPDDFFEDDHDDDPNDGFEEFEFDPDELEGLPEEFPNQTIPYRVSQIINGVLHNKLTREELLDPSMILRRNLQDPFNIEDVLIDQQDMFNTIKANFTKMRIKGLKGIQLDRVVANMSGQSILFEASIPTVTVTGKYSLNSYFAFVTLEGADNLVLNISDLKFVAEAKIEQNGGVVRINDISARVGADMIDLHLFELSGWGSQLINLCSEMIFENIKDGLLEDLRNGFKTRANAELAKTILPFKIDYQQDVRLIDALLQEANENIRKNRKEPLKLPPYIGRVKQNLLLMVFQSEVKLVRGVLSGLSTMHRTGDVVGIYADRTLKLEAHFGFHNLSGKYDFYAHIMGIGPSGIAEITMKNVSIKLELELSLRRRAKFIVRSLTMYRIEHIDTSISGLGSGDPASEILVNFLTNAFSEQLAEWLMEGCRKNIQMEADKVNIQLLR